MARSFDGRPVVVALVGLGPMARAGVLAELRAHADISVAHIAARFGELEPLHARLRADVLLVDGREFPPPGPTSVRGAVIVLSDDVAPASAWLALGAGARGYLTYRETGGERLAEIIRRMSVPGIHLSPDVAHGLVGALQEPVPEPSAAPTRLPLSDRELEILDLVGNGLPGRDIAVRLGLSEGTVRNNLHRIYMKLGVRGRAEAMAVWFAARGGTEVPAGRDRGLR